MNRLNDAQIVMLRESKGLPVGIGYKFAVRAALEEIEQLRAEVEVQDRRLADHRAAVEEACK
jgi:hypothetical protein